MSEKLLMKGNEVIAEAAYRAGCRFYAGYPITPQSDIAHYLARRMQQDGSGVFIQAESEIAAINMVYGASAAGARAMTSSSSPGISLKQEGLSFMACAELPGVVINIARAGPGLGGVLPAQGDYFQAVKGGGHGDYRLVVFAPSNIQELYELMIDAFNIADKYRVVVMIMGDGTLGQMIEVVEFREHEEIVRGNLSWTVSGTENQRQKNTITSIYVDPDKLESVNRTLQEKYVRIKEAETRVDITECENADIIVAAYGITARIVQSVMEMATLEGVRVGLIRPVSLWPFPDDAFRKYAKVPKAFLTVEMSSGQMVEDVRLALEGKNNVHFYGRMGGNVPLAADIMNEIRNIYRKYS